MTKQAAWTHYEIKRLKQLVDEGKTNAEIAKVLNRSRYAVTSKRQRLGIVVSPNKLTRKDPQLVAQIIKFKMAEWKTADIAELFDTTADNIRHFLQSLGFSRHFKRVRTLQKPYQLWTDYQIHTLRKYLSKGYPLERIHTYFPSRSFSALEQKAREITKHWMPDAEFAEREKLRLRWRNRDVYYLRGDVK